MLIREYWNYDHAYIIKIINKKINTNILLLTNYFKLIKLAIFFLFMFVAAYTVIIVSGSAVTFRLLPHANAKKTKSLLPALEKGVYKYVERQWPPKVTRVSFPLRSPRISIPSARVLPRTLDLRSMAGQSDPHLSVFSPPEVRMSSHSFRSLQYERSWCMGIGPFLQVEFLAEDEKVEIIPKFSLGSLHMICVIWSLSCLPHYRHRCGFCSGENCGWL